MRLCAAFILCLLAAGQTLRINVGGPAVVVDGALWEADHYYTTAGATYPLPAGAGLPEYMMDLRYGNFLYEIPTPVGTYDVRLWFADPLVGGTGGSRSFSVNVNGGQSTLLDLDVIAEAGGPLRPLSKTVRVTANGTIRIQVTTTVRNAILNALEVIPIPPVVAIRCPEPILSLRDSRTLVIGANWTTGTPCWVHQNMTIGVDPLHVQTLTAPIEVKLKPGQTTNDDLWVTLTSPTRTEPAKLYVSGTGATLDATVETSPSYTLTPHTTPRTFRPASSPVGMAYVRAGEFLPLLHGFLGQMPIYIDGTVPVSVVTGDGGFRFVLNPAAAQQAQVLRQKEQQAELLQQRSIELLRSMAAAQEAVLKTPELRDGAALLASIHRLRTEFQELAHRQGSMELLTEDRIREILEKTSGEVMMQARMQAEGVALDAVENVRRTLSEQVMEAQMLAERLHVLRQQTPEIRVAVAGGGNN